MPAGTYRVTGTISKRFADGSYNAGLVLVGAGQSRTIIRLADGTPGFQDPLHPKAVLYTAGKGFAQAPKNGYALRGEGDDAFSNFIENLTVDVGANNPGAVGIDYLANNQGAIRAVTVVGAGRTGIAMTRPWIGPALLEAVTVTGFAVGVDIASIDFSVTIEGLALSGQSEIGLRNADNLVSIHGLSIKEAGTRAVLPIVNQTAAGEVVVDGGSIEGHGGEAITNNGTAFLRRVRISGYRSAAGASVNGAAVVDGVYRDNQRIADATPPWALTAADPPSVADEAVGAWVSVLRFAPAGGNVGTEGVDATSAIRAAFASGARTVYFPFGVYDLTANIDVPPSVHRIIGMNSTIRWVPTAERSADDPTKGLFRAHGTTDSTVFEKFFFSFPRGHHVAIEQAGSAPLVMRDIVGMGAIFLRDASGGALFLNNISGGFAVRISGPAPVWGRQVDTEGGGARGGSITARIINDGAPLWILGLKSEGDNTLIASSAGAVTDVLGVLFASLRGGTLPLFTAADSRLQATGVEVALKPNSNYKTILVQSTGSTETTLTAERFPPRAQTSGVMLPLVSTR